MNKTYFLSFFIVSTVAFSQLKDSTSVAKDSLIISNLNSHYTPQDVARIDSLILENKFQSVFMDEIKEYYISNTDTTDISDINLEVQLLKERLSKINETTPFHLAYNPAL